MVLGCVHDIYHSEISVSLPGIGNFGYVKLNNISSIYAAMLKDHEPGKTKNSECSSLASMYSKGNLLRCKVLSFTNNKLNLTIEPNEVNSNLAFKNIEEEMVFINAN